MAKQLEDVTTDHDYDGIKEFDNPLPAWWLWTFAISTVVAVLYWMGYHSLPAKSSFEEHTIALEEHMKKLAANSVSEEELIAVQGDAETIAAGREVFVANCKSCHGDSGGGGIGANLTDKYWLHGSGPKEIWTTIAMGVAEKGMPAWRPVLGDTKVKQVYAFIHTLRDTNVAGGKQAEGVDAQGNAP